MSPRTAGGAPTEGIAELPTSLDALAPFSAECGCGRTHEVEMAGASVRAGAIEDTAAWADDVGAGLSVRVVADRITREIAGDRVMRLLSRAGHRVEGWIVEDGPGGRPCADDRALASVEAALAGADLAVAVGSGTINDLTKLASFRSGIPYLAVATAPSMNGYTSAIAAVSERGVKRTIECREPHAVIADLDVLAAAPRDLVAAGLGDLESKPTCTADFRLAGRLRGDYYCPAAERVAMAAEARAAEVAPDLARGDPEAIAALVDALLLSGLSMRLAGSSAPASGGEHLISHFWDMTAAEEGRVEGWHGAQVGVATAVAAALYERLRAVDPSSIDPDAIVAARAGREEIARGIAERHGGRAAEVRAEYWRKHLGDEALREELTAVRDGWDDMWSGLDDALRPASRIREILSSAGAPVTVREIGLSPDHLRRAFVGAREIRGRFTVLDLAADMGMLEEVAEEVLAASGCMGH